MADKDDNTKTGTFAADKLRGFVERIEKMDDEQRAIADDKKDVYAEAKAVGFDAKAIRKVVQLRKLDTDERKEQDALLDTYLHALGMI